MAFKVKEITTNESKVVTAKLGASDSTIQELTLNLEAWPRSSSANENNEFLVAEVAYFLTATELVQTLWMTKEANPIYNPWYWKQNQDIYSTARNSVKIKAEEYIKEFASKNWYKVSTIITNDEYSWWSDVSVQWFLIKED